MSNNINLEQKLEYKGYWYLPSSPENKVAGVITYYPGEKIVLELIGCFDNSISSKAPYAKAKSDRYDSFNLEAFLK